MTQDASAAQLFMKIVKGDDPQDLCKQQIGATLQTQNKAFVKELVDTAKSFIKSESNNGLTKNRALRLIGQFMKQENQEFISYVESKLLKKLVKYAKTDTNLPTSERGKRIFGEYEDHNQAQKFYNYTLECIQNWSNQFSMDPSTRGESAYRQAYKQLESNKVVFPNSSAQNQQKGQQQSHQTAQPQQNPELVEYKKKIQQLDDMLQEFQTAFITKKPVNEVLMMIKNKWNAVNETSNYLDTNQFKFTFELDLPDNQRINKNAQFIQKMQSQMQSIQKDQSKLNEGFRVSFLDTWSKIKGDSQNINRQSSAGLGQLQQSQLSNSFNQQNRASQNNSPFNNSPYSQNNSPYNQVQNRPSQAQPSTFSQKVSSQTAVEQNPFDFVSNNNDNAFKTQSSLQTPNQQQNFNFLKDDNPFEFDFQPNNFNNSKNNNDANSNQNKSPFDDDFFGFGDNKNVKSPNLAAATPQTNQNQNSKQDFNFEFDFMDNSPKIADSQVKSSTFSMNALPPKIPSNNKTPTSQNNSQQNSRRESFTSLSNQQNALQSQQYQQQQFQNNKSQSNNSFNQNTYSRKGSMNKQNSQEFNNSFQNQRQSINNFTGFDMPMKEQQQGNQIKRTNSGVGQTDQSDPFRISNPNFGFGEFSMKMSNASNKNQGFGASPNNQNNFDTGNTNKNQQSSNLNFANNNFGDFYFGDDQKQSITNPQQVESQFQYMSNMDGFYNNNTNNDKKRSNNSSQHQEKNENPLTISQKLELGVSEFNMNQVKVSQGLQKNEGIQNSNFDDFMPKKSQEQFSYSDFNNDLGTSNNAGTFSYSLQKQQSNKSNNSSQHQQRQQADNNMPNQMQIQSRHSTSGNFTNQQYAQQQVQVKNDFLAWDNNYQKQDSKEFQIESNQQQQNQGVYRSSKQSLDGSVHNQGQGGIGSNYFTSGVNNPMASSVGSEQSQKKQQTQQWDFGFDTNFQNPNQFQNEATASRKFSQQSGIDQSGQQKNNFGNNNQFDWLDNDFNNNQKQTNNQNQNNNFNFESQVSQNEKTPIASDDSKVNFWMQQKAQKQIFGFADSPSGAVQNEQQNLGQSHFLERHNTSTSKKSQNQITQSAFGEDAFGEISEATGGEDSQLEAQKFGFADEQKTNEKDDIPNYSRRSDDFDDLLASEIDLVKLNKKRLQEIKRQDENEIATPFEQNNFLDSGKQKTPQNNQNEPKVNNEVAQHKQFIKTKQAILAEQIDYEQLKKTQSDNTQQKDNGVQKPFSPLPQTQSSNLNNKRRSSIEEWALKKQMETQVLVPKPFDFEAQKQKSEERRRSEGQAVLYQQVLNLQQNQLKLVTINEEDHPQQGESTNTNRQTLQLFQGQDALNQYPNVNLILPSTKGQKADELVVLQEGQLRNPLQSKSSFSDEDDYLDSPETKKKESEFSHDNNHRSLIQNRSASNYSQKPSSNPQIILAESDIIPYPDENSQGSRLSHDHHRLNILESEVIKPISKDNSLSPHTGNRQILQSEYILQQKSQTLVKEQSNNFKPILTESYVETGVGSHANNQNTNFHHFQQQKFDQSEQGLQNSSDDQMPKVGSTVVNRLSVEKSVEQTIEELKFDLDDFPLIDNAINSPRTQLARKRQLSTINEEQEQGEDPEQSSFAAAIVAYEQRIEQIKQEKVIIAEQQQEIKSQVLEQIDKFQTMPKESEDDFQRAVECLSVLKQNQIKIKQLKDKFKSTEQLELNYQYKKTQLHIEKLQQDQLSKVSSVQSSQKQTSDDLIESLKREIQDLKNQGPQPNNKNQQEQAYNYSDADIGIIEEFRVQMSRLKQEFENRYNESSKNFSTDDQSNVVQFIDKLSTIEKNINQQKDEIQKLSTSQNDIQKQFLSISRQSNQQFFSSRTNFQGEYEQEEKREYYQQYESNQVKQQEQQQQNNYHRQSTTSEQGEVELFPQNQFYDTKNNQDVDENDYRSVRENDQENKGNYLTPSRYSPIISRDQENNNQDNRIQVNNKEQNFKQSPNYNQEGNNYRRNQLQEQNQFDNARIIKSQYKSDDPQNQNSQQDENLHNSRLKQLYERTASHTLVYEQNNHLKSIYQDPYVLMKAYEAQQQSQANTINSPYDLYGSFQQNRAQQRFNQTTLSSSSAVFHEAINFSINSYKVNYVVSNYNMTLKDKQSFQHTEEAMQEYNRYYDPLMELNQKQLGKEFYPNNEWFEKNLKQYVKRLNLEKKTIKDSIINQNCIILETFDLQVSAKYSIVKTTNSSGQQDPRYPSQILKYEHKQLIDPSSIRKRQMFHIFQIHFLTKAKFIFYQLKGYETVLADPPKILQNTLQPHESIIQDVYLPNYKANSQLLVSQFSYKPTRVGALIPCTSNKFMDFNFISIEQFDQMWLESKDQMMYNSPAYLNTHIIQSCQDFKNIYPCMIDLVEEFQQYKVSWRELGGAFTLLNDPYPEIIYLVKICYSYDERLYFQFSSVGQDQVQAHNVKKILASIMELFYFLYCE